MGNWILLAIDIDGSLGGNKYQRAASLSLIINLATASNYVKVAEKSQSLSM